MNYNVKDLPAATQERLSLLTSLTPAELGKEDVAFLKARSVYLKPEQKEVYKELLSEPKPAPKAKK
jgi:hypothetical protein